MPDIATGPAFVGRRPPCIRGSKSADANLHA